MLKQCNLITRCRTVILANTKLNLLKSTNLWKKKLKKKFLSKVFFKEFLPSFFKSSVYEILKVFFFEIKMQQYSFHHFKSDFASGE